MPVCDTCNDTRLMTYGDGQATCTQCTGFDPVMPAEGKVKAWRATAGLKWLGAKLGSRARDARQAEQYAKGFDPVAYPHAARLAATHAQAAEVYERQLADVLRALEGTNNGK